MIGESYRSPAYTIDDADLAWFASWSLDFARVHTDVQYASRTIFGKPVGHGMLGLCMAEGLLSRARDEAIVFSWEWSFVAPFFIGDTIWAKASVVDEQHRSGLTVRTEDVTVYKNEGDVIQRGRHRLGCAADTGSGADWRRLAMSGPTQDFTRDTIEESASVPLSTAQAEHMKETGVFYEDRPVGYSFRSPSFTIGEMSAGVFASLTGEMDTLYHTNHADGKRYLAPLLGFAIVEGFKHSLSPDGGVGTTMASLSWRWHQSAPLAVGDTVYLEATIDGRRASTSKTDRGLISQSLSLIATERGEVQRGQHVQMIRRRMASGVQ